MKTINLSFSETLKILDSYPDHKKKFLKELSKYEEKEEVSKYELYFHVLESCLSWGIDPLFESKENVDKYFKRINKCKQITQQQRKKNGLNV